MQMGQCRAGISKGLEIIRQRNARQSKPQVRGNAFAVIRGMEDAID